MSVIYSTGAKTARMNGVVSEIGANSIAKEFSISVVESKLS